MHAFWFALILPGFVFAIAGLPRLRSSLIWLLGASFGLVYLAIFSLPDLQGLAADTGLADNFWQRILYRLVLSSNLPLVPMLAGCLINLGLVLTVCKPKSAPNPNLKKE